MAQSALDKVVSASVTGGGNFIRSGKYTYLVERFAYVPDGYKGERCVLDLRVIEAEDSGALDEKGQPITANAVGSSCSTAETMSGADTGGGGRVKAYLIALLAPLGQTEGDITVDRIREWGGPSNPFRGFLLQNETYQGVNKGKTNPQNAGKPITKCSWKPVMDQAASIPAQRAWLDSNATKAETRSMFAPPAPKASTAPAPVVTPTAPATSATSNLLASLGLK